MNRPYILVKTAMSVDGYIDDATSKRRLFSSEEDREAVAVLRATFDAVLVGAQTVRSDNPRLIVSPELQAKRITLGLKPELMKVTITKSGYLDPLSHFFTLGGAEKVVYAPSRVAVGLAKKLRPTALVVGFEGEEANAFFICEDLFRRGVKKLMIEGGASTIALFLSSGLVDDIRIAVAPFFIGDTGAPPFIREEASLGGVTLNSVESLGQTSVMHFHADRSA